MENGRPWWNTWFVVQEIYLYSRQSGTKNALMPTRMDDQQKDRIDPKGPKQRNRPKNLQTHNLSTNDVENINSPNKVRDLLLANEARIVPWGAERMPKRIQRHSRVTFQRPAHPKREQDQTEKCSYGLDWLQKGILYGSAKLNIKLLQNVQNVIFWPSTRPKNTIPR